MPGDMISARPTDGPHPPDLVVHLDVRDGVAWIALDRPAAMNAINNAMREQLPAAVRRADDDPAVRVMVLHGSGGRAFCAGADLKEVAAADSLPAYRQSRRDGGWIAAFDAARKPLIAAIRGHCLGGGLEIALACDIRIAATDARLGLPEVGRGLITGVGGSQRLRRVVGLGRALDMILTGEAIDAETACRIGLVSRLAPPGEELALAADVAARIAANAPMAVAFAKEAVRRGGELDLAAGMTLELDLLTLLMSSEDRLEAAAAFRDKRKPKFRGR